MAQMARTAPKPRTVPKAVPKHNIPTAQGKLPKLARTGLVPKAQNHTKALHAPVSKAQPPGAAPVVCAYP